MYITGEKEELIFHIREFGDDPEDYETLKGHILFTRKLAKELKEDKKLRRTARSSNPQIFAESIFPKVFERIAQESYVEQTEAYTALFQDKTKYNAIMVALAEILYREFNKRD